VLNSSIIPLGANAEFVGQFEDLRHFNGLSVHVSSDRASATDGLVLEFAASNNPQPYEIKQELTNLTAGAVRSLSFSVRSGFFRVRYKNGTTPQTRFELVTMLLPNAAGVVTKALKHLVTENNFAQLVQAPVMAKALDGAYLNIAGIKIDSTALLGIADSTAIMGNQGFGFKATTNRVSTGSTGETPYLLIDNPGGSGKILRLDKMLFIPTESTGAVTFRVYRGPTVTVNGTLLTPVGNRNTGQAAAVSNMYLQPTVSANGSLFFHVTLNAESPPFLYDLEQGTLLEPGFKLLVTADQTVSNSGGGVNLDYSEAIP
jgi:hypothetical protein